MSDFELVGRVLREDHGRGYIAFNRSFAIVAGSANGGLFLSQAAWLSKEKGNEEGWFYHTQTQWSDSTMLTRYEQEHVRAHLREIGVLEETKREAPAKLFYRVRFDKIGEILASLDVENQQTRMGETSKQASGKTPSSYRKSKEVIKDYDVSSPPDGGVQGDSPLADSPEQQKPTREERDALWMAVVDFAGFAPGTKAEQSNLGGVVKQLLEGGFTPRHVVAAGKEWDRIWGDRTKTYRALVNHISTLLVSRKKYREEGDRKDSPMRGW